MSNYNQQQQSVILKGIAQNILQMNVPTFEQANKLFKEFQQILVTKENDDLLEYIYHHFNGAFNIESFKKGLNEKNQITKTENWSVLLLNKDSHTTKIICSGLSELKAKQYLQDNIYSIEENEALDMAEHE